VAKPESSHKNTKKKYSHCLYFRLLKKVTGRWPFSRKWEENEMPVAIFVIHNPFMFIQRYSGNFKTTKASAAHGRAASAQAQCTADAYFLCRAPSPDGKVRASAAF